MNILSKLLLITLLCNIANVYSACSTLKLINKVSIKGCDTDFCNSDTTLQYFSSSNTSSGGQVVGHDSSISLSTSGWGSSHTFGLQLNAARVGSASVGSTDRCDQLCGHITLDLNTGEVTQGDGTCGSNSSSPTWSIGGTTGSINSDKTICTVTIANPIINNPTLCHCDWGAYPCAGD